jgi:hypothetical protein
VAGHLGILYTDGPRARECYHIHINGRTFDLPLATHLCDLCTYFFEEEIVILKDNGQQTSEVIRIVPSTGEIFKKSHKEGSITPTLLPRFIKGHVVYSTCSLRSQKFIWWNDQLLAEVEDHDHFFAGKEGPVFYYKNRKGFEDHVFGIYIHGNDYLPLRGKCSKLLTFGNDKKVACTYKTESKGVPSKQYAYFDGKTFGPFEECFLLEDKDRILLITNEIIDGSSSISQIVLA